jgi:glycosyltransferase involved in cell wall biosynthesis
MTTETGARLARRPARAATQPSPAELTRTETLPPPADLGLAEAVNTPAVSLPRISVVIPALNEAENLPHVLPHVPDVHEIILVDGWSTDGTSEVARQLRPEVRIVAQDAAGKGAALRSGFRAATGDIIVMLDADGSTDPREIPRFVDALLEGADFVKGSRFLPGGGTADMPAYRKLGNFAFVVMVRMLYGGRYTDLCYGYNAFWRRVLPALDLDGDGFEIETMMNVRALRSGLRIAEVPSFESKRVYGESRLRTIPDGLRVLRTILHERVRRGQAQQLRDTPSDV